MVTPGAKPILFYSMLALLESGDDEVLYPNPGFPMYESVIGGCGAQPVPVPLLESRGFSIDLDRFADSLSDRTRLIILNTPQNPTGGTIPPEDLRAIAELVVDRDLVVLSDEIYNLIAFDEQPTSIASIDGMAEKTIVLDGFSKAYSMTGWRIGYGVFPEWMVEAICMLQVNCSSHTASFTQRAALEALRGPQDSVTTMVDEFRRRRDVIVSRLNAPPGRALRPARRGLLCVPELLGHRLQVGRSRRPDPAGSRRSLSHRNLVRRIRRGLSALQLRHRAGSDRSRHGSRPGISRLSSGTARASSPGSE